jgi:hypothetical protein
MCRKKSGKTHAWGQQVTSAQLGPAQHRLQMTCRHPYMCSDQHTNTVQNPEALEPTHKNTKTYLAGLLVSLVALSLQDCHHWHLNGQQGLVVQGVGLLGGGCDETRRSRGSSKTGATKS